MKHVMTVAWKEFVSYFNSPLAYIFIDVFLVVMGFLFYNNYFLYGQADMRQFFGLIPWVFLFLVPAITMRVWAEEQKIGTVEILLTLPVKETSLVLGKFLGSFFFLATSLLLSFMIPATVIWSGSADIGVIFASYLGALLLGAAYISLGVWISSYTDNQIVAFILAIVVSFTFLIVGQNFVLSVVPDFLTPAVRFLGLGTHFESVSRGVVDSRDMIYYLSFIGFFLFLNVQRVVGRRFK